jgi:hypothetical protein
MPPAASGPGGTEAEAFGTSQTTQIALVGTLGDVQLGHNQFCSETDAAGRSPHPNGAAGCAAAACPDAIRRYASHCTHRDSSWGFSAQRQLVHVHLIPSSSSSAPLSSSSSASSMVPSTTHRKHRASMSANVRLHLLPVHLLRRRRYLRCSSSSAPAFNSGCNPRRRSERGGGAMFFILDLLLLLTAAPTLRCG